MGKRKENNGARDNILRHLPKEWKAVFWANC